MQPQQCVIYFLCAYQRIIVWELRFLCLLLSSFWGFTYEIYAMDSLWRVPKRKLRLRKCCNSLFWRIRFYLHNTRVPLLSMCSRIASTRSWKLFNSPSSFTFFKHNFCENCVPSMILVAKIIGISSQKFVVSLSLFVGLLGKTLSLSLDGKGYSSPRYASTWSGPGSAHLNEDGEVTMKKRKIYFCC